MKTERDFNPEQNLPIEKKDVENQLRQLDKELIIILNKIRGWVEDYNQRAGRIVFEPVKPRSTNISGLQNKINPYKLSRHRLGEPWAHILGLIEQASGVKEQRRLIRHNLFVAREAKRSERLERERSLMETRGWKRVFENDIKQESAQSAKTKRKGNLSELEEESGDDEVVDESE